MRSIDKIIIHCSATKPHQDIGADEIRSWHVEDNGWDDIGYHFVIRRNGVVEAGRALESPGAHTKGHNAQSIGLCLVGGLDTRGRAENNFTAAQWVTLERMARDLTARFPAATVHGHRDFAPKDCPCFDAGSWWAEVSA